MRHLAPPSFCCFSGQIHSGDSNSGSKLERVRYYAPLFVFERSAFAKHGLFEFFSCRRDESIRGLERPNAIKRPQTFDLRRARFDIKLGPAKKDLFEPS